MRIDYQKERGDTLIEVLMAITVMAIVVTLSYSAMVRSYAQGLVSLERSQTAALMNASAMILRDQYDTYEKKMASGGDTTTTEWYQVKHWGTTSLVNSSANVPVTVNNGCTMSTGIDLLYFDPSAANPISPKTKSNVSLPLRTGTTPAYNDGIWVEGFRVTPVVGGPTYFDFYIKACWNSQYGGGQQAMVTTVRIYDPIP